MTLAPLETRLSDLSQQPALLAEANFAGRAQALDELEACLLHLPPSPAALGLRRRAQALQARLEAVDQRLFRRLRAEIRAGQLVGTELGERLLAYAGAPAAAPDAARYDTLDALTNGLFPEPAELLEPAAARDPEMVYYQKTPARVIFVMAARLRPTDVLYDLGSGLGQVPLLAHLLSGARTHGIEIEPDYCRHARRCAGTLHLPQVRFQCADARRADFADATAFYLFTPFTGGIMREVLARLQERAQIRPLRVFSYGPSTEALRLQPWLRRVGEEQPLYQLAEFRRG